MFEAEPKDISVYAGEVAFFSCSVRAPLSPRRISRMMHAFPQDIRVQWLKNETPLRLDETRMTVLPSGALEIDPVNLQDRGSYRCNITRVGGMGYRLEIRDIEITERYFMIIYFILYL